MPRLPSLGPRGEGWVTIQVLLLALVGAAALTGPAWSGTSRLLTTLAGILLIIAGGVLALGGIVGLRDALTPFPRPVSDGRLVDSGAYRLVRHPIYGGIVIGAAGWALLTAAPLAGVAALALLGFFVVKSRLEEAWLAERYEGYDAYRARTRRLIPWLY